MKNRIFLIIIFLISFLSSCIGPKETNLLQDIPKDYSQDNVAPLDYKIIPGDQISLKIYTLDESMKELFSAFMSDSRERTTEDISSGGHEIIPYNVLTVSPDGTIKIPYIGEIYVLNMTTLEANKIIANKFSDFSPNVKVDVNLRNRYFYILGELGAKPVPMQHLRMTVLQALAQTGTMTTFGDRKKVKILRQTATGTEIKVFDIRSQDIVNSEYYYIQPNDVIYVPQLNRKFFGSITSFAGIFSMITMFAGVVLTVWGIVDKNK